MDWFLYDIDLCHERVFEINTEILSSKMFPYLDCNLGFTEQVERMKSKRYFDVHDKK